VRTAYRTDEMAGAAWEWSWQQGQTGTYSGHRQLVDEVRRTKRVDWTIDSFEDLPKEQ